MPKSDLLKTNFVVDSKIESFYLGGSIAVNRNCDRLFTQCGNQINCLDFNNGKIKYVIGVEETENDVSSFVLSPCDDFLVVAYKNLLLKQFDVKDDNEAKIHRIWKSGHNGTIGCVTFSDDSLILATGSSDCSVKIWDTKAQYCTHTLKNGCVTCVQFAPESWNRDNNYFVAFGDDVGNAFVYDLKKNGEGEKIRTRNKEFFTLSHHTSAVTAFLFDDNFLYTAGRDSIVVQCDRRANFVATKIIAIFEAIESMVFVNRSPTDLGKKSVDEKFIATVGDTGRLKIWSVATSKCVQTCAICEKSSLRQLVVCDEIRSLVVSTSDQLILSISCDDFSTINRRLVGNNEEIYDATFVCENDSRLAVATNANDLRIYDVQTFDCRLLTGGHTDTILAIDVAPWDHNIFATCSKDNKIFVWRCDQNEKFKRVFVATGHANSVTCVRFSRLKSSFLTSVSDDRTLKLWKLPSNFSADGDETPSTLTASSTVVAHEKDIRGLDLSPNDRLVATCSMDKTIKLWTLSNKFALTPLGTISDHKRGVWDVRFSPTDQVLASCSGDFSVKIFALEDLSCLKTFEGHQATVIRVNFLPTGVQLLSADTGGLIKLWTIKSNECVRTFDEHESRVFALNLNAMGDKMISGGADAKLLLWRDVTEGDRFDDDEKRKETIANEQKLNNFIDARRYADALRLALLLNRPFNALNVLKKLTATSCSADVETLVKSLNVDQLNVLLSYLVEWNSNSRNFYVAQMVLSGVLKSFTPEQLLKLTNIKQIVEGLTPYSERHFERLSKNREQSYFVDFTWETVKLKSLPLITNSSSVKMEIEEN